MKTYIALFLLVSTIATSAQAAARGVYQAEEIASVLQSNLFLNDLTTLESIQSVNLNADGTVAVITVDRDDNQKVVTCTRQIQVTVGGDGWNPIYSVASVGQRVCQ